MDEAVVRCAVPLALLMVGLSVFAIEMRRTKPLMDEVHRENFGQIKEIGTSVVPKEGKEK